MSKPTYMIIGACGFIGRSLLHRLVVDNLAYKVIAVDKSRPEVSWLNNDHRKSFDNKDIVIIKQINMANSTNVEKLFNEFDIDYVVNCACESRSTHTDEVYEEKIIKIGLNTATQSARKNIKRYIYISSADVYSGKKSIKNETSPIDPWNKSAKYKNKLENELTKISNLNYTILRTSIVYGKADKQNLTPRLIVGAVYKQLNEPMKLLWSCKLHMNTVHVEDVIKAVLFVCNNEKTLHNIYNLSDKSNSTQGSISEMIKNIFQIKYDFFGSTLSKAYSLCLETVTEESNSKHMQPWSELCSKDKIECTPLSPYIDKELLRKNHLFIDGSLIESLGFVYGYPLIKTEYLKEIVDDFVEQKIFPTYK